MKKILLLGIVFLLAAHPALAGDDGQKQGPSFWEKIRTKIEKITPKQKPTVTTAVGGVRGARQDSDDLYWKGEENHQPIDAEELNAFSEALLLVDNNLPTEAAASFEKFLKKFPHSSLASDAQQALKLLQTQP